MSASGTPNPGFSHSSRSALGGYACEMADEREVLTWAGYGPAARELAQQVADDGYRPEMLLAVARGGLLPAGSVGYALSVKNIYVMNVEYYTGVDSRLDVPVMLPPYLDLVDMEDVKVLIVDDVADTGHTLKLVHDFLLERVGEVRSAVLYEKPQSLVKCEYVWKRTAAWINFPWSTESPLVSAELARHKVVDA